MARYSEPIQTNPAAIRKFAESLRAMAADFDSQADKMDEMQLSSVEVTHWKSARDGVKGYAAFAAAITKAIVNVTQMSAVDSLLDKKIESSQASVKLAEGLLPAPPRQQKPKKPKS